MSIDIDISSCVFILLAAGKGTRFKNTDDNYNLPKQFHSINGKPIFIYSLMTFLKFCSERGGGKILLVVPEGYEKYTLQITQKFLMQKNTIEKDQKGVDGICNFDENIIEIITGGKSRAHSVYNAIKYIEDRKREDINFRKIKYAMIHDSARPFLNEKILSNILDELKLNNNITTAIQSTDTICMGETCSSLFSKENRYANISLDKKQNVIIKKYLDRDRCFQVQTPQAFDFELLSKAYGKIFKKIKSSSKIKENKNKKDLEKVLKLNNFTDDCSLVKNICRGKISIVKGDSLLFKITYRSDFYLADYIAKNQEIFSDYFKQDN
ncbi:MAG: 2-C-methyl-D-erythritol 4-phosphate cytidylyltransferase [Exilispira sp.]|nr:2-C-methyl-D-erythritol 4-phosphate cytidylyltransferase [Exilispira sp.]